MKEIAFGSLSKLAACSRRRHHRDGTRATTPPPGRIILEVVRHDSADQSRHRGLSLLGGRHGCIHVLLRLRVERHDLLGDGLLTLNRNAIEEFDEYRLRTKVRLHSRKPLLEP